MVPKMQALHGYYLQNPCDSGHGFPWLSAIYSTSALPLLAWPRHGHHRYLHRKQLSSRPKASLPQVLHTPINSPPECSQPGSQLTRVPTARITAHWSAHSQVPGTQLSGRGLSFPEILPSPGVLSGALPSLPLPSLGKLSIP